LAFAKDENSAPVPEVGLALAAELDVEVSFFKDAGIGTGGIMVPPVVDVAF
jgi:hypothetical protein